MTSKSRRNGVYCFNEDLSPIMMSLCFARVTATFSRRLSSRIENSCKKSWTARGNFRNFLENLFVSSFLFRTLGSLHFSATLRVHENKITSLSRPWYWSTVLTSIPSLSLRSSSTWALNGQIIPMEEASTPACPKKNGVSRYFSSLHFPRKFLCNYQSFSDNFSPFAAQPLDALLLLPRKRWKPIFRPLYTRLWGSRLWASESRPYPTGQPNLRRTRTTLSTSMAHMTPEPENQVSIRKLKFFSPEGCKFHYVLCGFSLQRREGVGHRRIFMVLIQTFEENEKKPKGSKWPSVSRRQLNLIFFS